jgi:NTE family protein
MLKSSARWLLSLTLGGLGNANPESFLDCTPLRELLERQIRFDEIEHALADGHLGALAITASAYTSARSVTFFQTGDQTLPWARVRRIGRPARITLDHVMASAAVPFMFPPVRVGSEYYGDGSMRQRAPLSPSIHLGADRLLVIGVRDEHPDPEPGLPAEASKPSFADVAGYMLDTLFMDGLYADLERLTRLNSIIEQVEASELGGPVDDLRPIRTLIVLPSVDIRDLAAAHVQEMPAAMRVLLTRMGALRPGSAHKGGMQLISYLLFEAGFTRALIDLGYRDARERAAELEAFVLDGQERPSQ